MNSQLNVYQCEYHVRLDYCEFDVIDWILTGSSELPSDNSVGHFWRTVRSDSNPVISNIRVSIADPTQDITKAIITNHRYIKQSESGQIIVLFLIAVVCIAIMLYMAYTAISGLAGTSSLFDTMIQSLSEVIK